MGSVDLYYAVLNFTDFWQLVRIGYLHPQPPPPPLPHPPP